MERSSFAQDRDAALERVLALIQKNIEDAKVPVVADIRDITLSDGMARKESWSLVERAVRHLKNGAPGDKPGSMAEALSKISLRSSSLAASLGVKPPQFEPMLLTADYEDGRAAALYICRRLIGAAEDDVLKSRQIIAQKILMEKPELLPVFAFAPKEDIISFKKQMALSLDLLVETYTAACSGIKREML